MLSFCLVAIVPAVECLYGCRPCSHLHNSFLHHFYFLWGSRLYKFLKAFFSIIHILHYRIVAFPFFLIVGVTCSLTEKKRAFIAMFSLLALVFFCILLALASFSSLFLSGIVSTSHSLVSSSASCNHEAIISGWKLQLQAAVVFFFFFFFFCCLLFFVRKAWQQIASALIVIRGLRGNNTHNYAKGSVSAFDSPQVRCGNSRSKKKMDQKECPWQFLTLSCLINILAGEKARAPPPPPHMQGLFFWPNRKSLQLTRCEMILWKSCRDFKVSMSSKEERPCASINSLYRGFSNP